MKEGKINLSDEKDRGDVHIDYKQLIVETIRKSEDDEKLELIYRFSKKILD